MLCARAAVQPKQAAPQLALSGALSRALCLVHRLRSKPAPSTLVRAVQMNRNDESGLGAL